MVHAVRQMGTYIQRHLQATGGLATGVTGTGAPAPMEIARVAREITRAEGGDSRTEHSRRRGGLYDRAGLGFRSAGLLDGGGSAVPRPGSWPVGPAPAVVAAWWPTRVVPIQMPFPGGNGSGPDHKQVVKLPQFLAAKTLTLSEDAEFWLGHLASAIVMNRWTYDQVYMWVRLSLEPPASRWFMTRERHFTLHHEGQEARWHTFWVEFEDRFIMKDESQIRTMFELCTQRQHETIYSYGDAILHLALQLGKDSKEVVRRFIKGLQNKQVKKRLGLARPATLSLDHAVEWVMEFELDIAAEKREKPDEGVKEGSEKPAAVDKGKAVMGGKDKGERTDLTSLHQQQQQQSKLLDDLHKRLNGLGQVVAKAALPGGGASSSSAPAMRPLVRRPLSEIRCRGCGEYGHFVRDCPKNAKSHSEAQNRMVFYEDEDLKQLHVDENVEDRVYLLQSIIEGETEGRQGVILREVDLHLPWVCTNQRRTPALSDSSI